MEDFLQEQQDRYRRLCLAYQISIYELNISKEILAKSKQDLIETKKKLKNLSENYSFNKQITKE